MDGLPERHRKYGPGPGDVDFAKKSTKSTNPPSPASPAESEGSANPAESADKQMREQALKQLGDG